MQQESSDIHIPRAILFFVMYAFLLLKAGFFFIERKNAITAPTFLIFLFALFLIYGKGIKEEFARVCIICVVLEMATWVFHGFPTLKMAAVFVVNLTTALLIVCIFSKEEFFSFFENVMLSISVISDVAWLIMFLGGKSFFQLFPSLVNSCQRTGYYAIFTIVSDFSSAGMQRNQGIFWEPGAFQALVCLAMLITISRDTSKRRIIKLVLFSVSVFLSFSTTGYIAVAMVWLVYLSSLDSRKLVVLLPLIVFISIVAFVFLCEGKITGYLKYTIIDKVKGVLNVLQGGKSENASVNARIDSFFLPIKLWITSPLFGIGEKGGKLIREIGTGTVCTPINYLTECGVFMGALWFFGLGRLINSPYYGKIRKICIVCTLMIAFISEDFFMNPILTAFLLYGYERNEKNEIKYTDAGVKYT